MVEKTRNTIAGVPHAIDHRTTRPKARAFSLLFALLVASIQTGGQPAVAAKPGGKSRYRSASQAGDGETGGRRGVFGIKSLLPGNRSDQSPDDQTLLDAIPMDRLTDQAKQRLNGICDKPTLYRRLPTQAIRCDEEMFLFLTRKPETIIGIWDLMGITKVRTSRVGPYEINAVDGCGTTCKIDLVYGDQNLHVFIADGMYDGKFVQKPIRGKGVFVFRSSYAKSADGSTTVTGTLDCFIKFESLGADLVARSLGGLIGKSADHNFTETAKFISQISQASETNPEGMLDLVDRMPQVDVKTKTEFARVILNVSQRYAVNTPPANRLVRDRGLMQTRP